MAQGTTQPRVKVTNPADFKDADVKDLLLALLATAQGQYQILRLMATEQGIDLPDDLDDEMEIGPS